MEINRDLQNKVENDSNMIENIVTDIVDSKTKELDNYILRIKQVIEYEDLTIEDLQRIMIRLCSYAYFVSSAQELMGIRQDISEALRIERYNNVYVNLTVGTVAKKTAEASEAVKEEAVIALIYNRVYKILKGKYDVTNRMIDAVKKIISAKIQSMQIGVRE